jgi:rSAM/selenodomain-associated transferase 1
VRLQRHLVIFAKEPRLGAVKRRLAAGIGALPALRFYRATTACLLRRLGRDRRWRCVLFVTPDRAASGPARWAAGVTRTGQGRGDLGQRMARALAGLPPGPAVIVGSDIPAIRPAHVAAAFALLGRYDFAFGPAVDGGYWLIGARRRPLPRGIFCGVRWSSEHALADTLASLPLGSRVRYAATLADVDDAAAHARWCRITPPSDAPAGAA